MFIGGKKTNLITCNKQVKVEFLEAMYLQDTGLSILEAHWFSSGLHITVSLTESFSHCRPTSGDLKVWSLDRWQSSSSTEGLLEMHVFGPQPKPIE